MKRIKNEILIAEFNPRKISTHKPRHFHSSRDLVTNPRVARIKKSFEKVFKIGLVIFFINKLVDFGQLLISTENVDPREVETPKTYININLVNNEEGQIQDPVQIEKQNQEQLAAKNHLVDRIKNDAKNFGIELESVESINGIYKHNFANENLSKDFFLDIMFEANGINNVIRYACFDKDVSDVLARMENENEEKILLNLAGLLQLSYPDSYTSQSVATETEPIVFEPFEYGESANSILIKVPCYTNSMGCVYSIPEKIIAENTTDENNLDVALDLLYQYLNFENDLFNEDPAALFEHSQKIEKAFNNFSNNENLQK